MKRIFFILSIFISIITPGFTQTKLIAHKSHSGKTSNFRTAMETNSSDLNSSNFGVPPKRYFPKIDTVKYISDSITIITNRYVSFRHKTLYRTYDTIYNHFLFKKGTSIDNLKKAIEEEFEFDNSSDSIVFIGFDKSSDVSKKTKKNFAPLLSFDNPTPPFNPKWIGIVSIFFIALVIALLGKRNSTMKRLLNER